MDDRVRISVSGIRGEVPHALNVEIVTKLSSAFASYLEKGRIALCRDSRPSSHMLKMASLSSLMSAGVDAVDFGLLPTPFLQFLLARRKYKGGISFTGGHSPYTWNAVLLLDADGAYLEASEGSEVFNVLESGDFKKVSWSRLGKVEKKDFPLDNYFHELSRLVDFKRIRDSHFKLVADPCNGALSKYLKDLSEYFDLSLISINDDPSKPFPHLPEPNQKNASQVEAVVKATDSDLGFLLNSDGSRVSFVDEKGQALSEEMTFPLCLLSLDHKIKKAVTTVVSSSLSDWVAIKTGISLIRTRVGQSAVVHSMKADGAEAGGEGSGSFSLIKFSQGYDALLSLVLILDLLAREDKKLSDVIDPLPVLHMRKIKIDIPPEKTYRIMDRLEDVYSREEPNFIDGIRINRDKAWFNIRPSLTEFIIRLTIESEHREIIQSIEEEIRERISV
ncbi:MAG: hypothetical protein JW755_03870 [Candidatus Aminicenantes bacterium]|nr:hypothetical protein [Candidatus Aminicenantes bacterium]